MAVISYLLVRQGGASSFLFGNTLFVRLSFTFLNSIKTPLTNASLCHTVPSMTIVIVFGNHSLWSKDEKEEIIERALNMYLKWKRRMKTNNLPGIQTSTEIDAPLPDDLSESDSDIEEIEELGLFEAENER